MMSGPVERVQSFPGPEKKEFDPARVRWPDGGVVTHRTANPGTRVRFPIRPPKLTASARVPQLPE